MLYRLARATCLMVILLPIVVSAGEPIRIGSKRFTESYILAEIMAQALEAKGLEVERKTGLGGTMIAFGALEAGGIDVYPEYTGTIVQAIFKQTGSLKLEEIESELGEKYRLSILRPFGFNNTYALALRGNHPLADLLENISDLARYSQINAVFTHEFIKRNDGWKALKEAYSLNLKIKGLEHNLAYDALAAAEGDLMDVYTTDAKIGKSNLKVLKDDKGFFPLYLAVPLVRADLPREAREVLMGLGGIIDEKTMIQLNAQAEIGKMSFPEIAQKFLVERGLAKGQREVAGRWDLTLLMRRAGQHLSLTFAAMFLAALVSIPLGIILFRLSPLWARPILVAAGLLQTIPSIALLAFMIPLFGIGVKPAVVGLFLYSLLPILRNTYSALSSINPQLRLVARGIGLYPFEVLRLIELPLALPVILTGLRTAAVINVGTATLAAFIGAGGLGEPIVTGLALNDPEIILQGAIPAALLAVVVELFFDYLEKMTNKKYGQT
ncbi:MAG: ABC transporter permease subunit, partial [Bdellovibrionales bacterium]|nr:ABC transporter permease subunit [Bdellovibrionales bacterium]